MKKNMAKDDITNGGERVEGLRHVISRLSLSDKVNARLK